MAFCVTKAGIMNCVSMCEKFFHKIMNSMHNKLTVHYSVSKNQVLIC